MTLPVAAVLTYLWIALFKGMGLAGLVGLLFRGVYSVRVRDNLCSYFSGNLERHTAPVPLARGRRPRRIPGYVSCCFLFIGNWPLSMPYLFVGSLASLWGLVLTVIGLREIHKTTTGRAVGTLAIPLGIVLVISLLLRVRCLQTWIQRL